MPKCEGVYEALDMIVEALINLDINGEDVYIALDIAASEFYDSKTKTYNIDVKNK